MASKKFENKSYHLQDGLFGLVQLFGKVQLDAGADTAAVSGKGFASVAYDGSAGEYVVTLDDSYAELHNAQFSVEFAGGVDAAVVLDSEDVANGTFKFVYQEAGLPAQPTVAAKVHFSLAMKG